MINTRPLHRHKMMDRRFLVTEQADLHMLRAENRFYLKPLPVYLLTHEFWTAHLCTDKSLHQNACGLLLSYVWLICYEHDFRIAMEADLIPKSINWIWWKAFVEDVLLHIDANALDQVNERYQYGELRLGRVNDIYRLAPGFLHTHFVRGYLYGYNRYVVFFQRNFAWLVVVFVYFSLVLSAMQVGLMVDPLQNNSKFQHASYGFVVFSIVLVLFVVGVVALLFILIFAYNTYATLAHRRLTVKGREKLVQQRQRGSHG